MNIAAELIENEITVFIEGLSWKKITLPFNNEQVKVELAVAFIKGICYFHDAASNPGPATTHDSLLFCRDPLTVGKFKREFKGTGKTEPYEVRLRNKHFALRKEFIGGYTLSFPDYQSNQVFANWLIKALPALDAASALKRLKAGKRYYSKEFEEFREFGTISKFIGHRFALWHDKAVKSENYDG